MDNQKLKVLLEETLAGQHDHTFEQVVSAIHCMSTKRVYAIINAIVSSMEPGEIYVEVGTYQGGSLVSALLGNEAQAIGVDSFQEFTQTNSLDRTRANLVKFGVDRRVVLRDMNYRDFFGQLASDFRIAVYYYDGEHNYEGQLAGMEAAWPFLRSGSIILVDDYSYPEVNHAVNQFVANHIEQVRFQFVMAAIESLDTTWWNGVVAIRVL